MYIISWVLNKFFLILSLLIAVIIHEYSHGWLAEKLGDSTAKDAGRLTLNPIPHIDSVGTIIIPISVLIISSGAITFGWARPVPISLYNLNNPRLDTAKISLAGPLSNLSIATIAALLLRLGGILPENIFTSTGSTPINNPFIIFLAYLIFINLLLGILNLIPIPPLDGSNILGGYLPRKIGLRYKKTEPYGIILILVLFFLFDGLNKIIFPLMGLILKLYSIH